MAGVKAGGAAGTAASLPRRGGPAAAAVPWAGAVAARGTLSPVCESVLRFPRIQSQVEVCDWLSQAHALPQLAGSRRWGRGGQEVRGRAGDLLGLTGWDPRAAWGEPGFPGSLQSACCSRLLSHRSTAQARGWS